MKDKQLLSRIAFWIASLISFPNAVLAFLFFALIFETRSYDGLVFEFILTVAAIILAVALVGGEWLVSILRAQEGSLKSAVGIALLIATLGFGLINVGGANNRTSENIRDSKQQAMVSLDADPEWQSLQKRREEANKNLNNSYKPDDHIAEKELEEIAIAEKAVKERLRSDSHVGAVQATQHANISLDWVLDSAFNNRKVVTLSLIIINLLTGICVNTWWKNRSSNQTPVKKVDKVEPPKTVTKEKIDNLRKKESNAAPEIRKLLKNPDYQHPDGKPIVTKIAEKVGRSRETVYNVIKSKGK